MHASKSSTKHFAADGKRFSYSFTTKSPSIQHADDPHHPPPRARAPEPLRTRSGSPAVGIAAGDAPRRAGSRADDSGRSDRSAASPGVRRGAGQSIESVCPCWFGATASDQSPISDWIRIA
jgi:hypothetical protein